MSQAMKISFSLTNSLYSFIFLTAMEFFFFINIVSNMYKYITAKILRKLVVSTPLVSLAFNGIH